MFNIITIRLKMYQKIKISYMEFTIIYIHNCSFVEFIVERRKEEYIITTQFLLATLTLILNNELKNYFNSCKRKSFSQNSLSGNVYNSFTVWSRLKSIEV